MARYDADGDGKIDAEELKQSPPLAEALETTDADGDGALTEKEIVDRIDAWSESGTNVVNQSTLVTLDGNPLEGATVTYEPEEFLQPPLESSSGVTAENGYAEVAGQDPNYPGLYLGLYRVRISKMVDGRETIPARYNTETILAKEIAPDAPSTSERWLVFELESR
jgi:hypothetical protein